MMNPRLGSGRRGGQGRAVFPDERGAGRRSRRSESTEDHLERIQELVDRVGYARVSDVAEALGLNRSTVSNMVRRLARRGYVNYQRYRGFTLTEAGREVAAQIKDRHRTLSELLTLLGLEAGTVEEEVEDIEHHLKPQTLGVLADLVDYWRAHPEALQAFRRHARRAGRVSGPGRAGR